MVKDQTAKESTEPFKGFGHKKCNTFVTPSRGSRKNNDFKDFLEVEENKKASKKDHLHVSLLGKTFIAVLGENLCSPKYHHIDPEKVSV